MPQELNIDPFFTPYELLELQAGLYGVPRNKRNTLNILKKLGLEKQRDSYARTLSGGMRRRLLVAKSLVHNPDIIILEKHFDEYVLKSKLLVLDHNFLESIQFV